MIISDINTATRNQRVERGKILKMWKTAHEEGLRLKHRLRDQREGGGGSEGRMNMSKSQESEDQEVKRSVQVR